MFSYQLDTSNITEVNFTSDELSVKNSPVVVVFSLGVEDIVIA